MKYKGFVGLVKHRTILLLVARAENSKWNIKSVCIFFIFALHLCRIYIPYGCQREPNIKTLCSSPSAIIWDIACWVAELNDVLCRCVYSFPRVTIEVYSIYRIYSQTLLTLILYDPSTLSQSYFITHTYINMDILAKVVETIAKSALFKVCISVIAAEINLKAFFWLCNIERAIFDVNFIKVRV